MKPKAGSLRRSIKLIKLQQKIRKRGEKNDSNTSVKNENNGSIRDATKFEGKI